MNIDRIIKEEITKAEVERIVNDKLSNSYSSRDFEKNVKEITSKVIDKLFKILWQRSNTWRSELAR